MSAPSVQIPKTKASDFTQDLDLSHDEFVALLELTQEVKSQPEKFSQVLRGKYLSLLFEKPSLRTRLTFELAIKQLGGDCVVQTGLIAEREPLKDVARNLDRWTHGIVARTYAQKTIDDLAHWSKVPVINALSDRFHPCQALADVFTLIERFGKNVKGLKVAFVGDGNNVAQSLLLCAVRLGVSFSIATPPGYELDPEVVATGQGIAVATGASIFQTHDPTEAVSGAHAVYTDVWASMGKEAEKDKRLLDFAAYTVTPALMKHADAKAIFLHCLPAKRGEEVTDEVIESPQSAVFDQAENRLHAQKALLLMLLAK